MCGSFTRRWLAAASLSVAASPSLAAGSMHRYPALPDSLSADLAKIPPSGGQDAGLLYYPCDALLKNGSALDCVYLCEEVSWFKTWGVWPEEDRGKTSLSVTDVRELRESRHRLPAKFANELYAHGESGMGYTIFTVEFRDGSRRAYVNGNAIDFIDYPPGKSAQDVVRVIPHEGRTSPDLRKAPDYVWCLFSRP